MTRPSATCELYVDGTRVPDTGIDLELNYPTALDGLSLTWGRDGANEQPGPAICEFSIIDGDAGPNFLDQLHVGSKITVWAEGAYEPAASEYAETFDDPAMSSWPLGDAYASRYASTAGGATVATVIDRDGNRVLQLSPRDTEDAYAGFAGTKVPPRRYSPTNTLPNAWDNIPRWMTADPYWRYSLRVRAPVGAVVRPGWSWYTNPYPAFGTVTSSPAGTVATGEWQTLSGNVGKIASGNNKWVGYAIDVTGLRSRWKEQQSTWAEQTTTWERFAEILIDDTSMKRPASKVTRRTLSFSGSVTDVVVTPREDNAVLIKATAADLGSDLGNRVIGDEPWPQQKLSVRADRVAQLGGITTSPRVRIDAPLGDLLVSYRDVDAQPAYGLLQDLAQTGGGVLWGATHAVTGAFLWIENPANRVPTRQLDFQGGLIVITGSLAGVTLLSACDLLRDDVSWHQDTADVATVVAVTWQEQTLDDDGLPAPTERTTTVSDSAAITTYGTRRLSVATDLTSSADASALANRLLAQARAVAWRVEGLTFDTAALFDTLDSVSDDQREIALLNLLDGTTRMGLALTLIDMPPYAPRGAVSSVYVEGGTYRFEDGAWTLSLAATPSVGQGASVKWNQLDAAWKWNQWAPSVTWQNLYGVAP